VNAPTPTKTNYSDGFSPPDRQNYLNQSSDYQNRVNECAGNCERLLNGYDTPCTCGRPDADTNTDLSKTDKGMFGSLKTWGLLGGGMMLGGLISSASSFGGMLCGLGDNMLGATIGGLAGGKWGALGGFFAGELLW
jgi:hypothetical protein